MATPPHLQLKVQQYSKLVKTNLGRYESGSFESGGINWKLVVYLPEDNRQKEEYQYVSLYLALDSCVTGNREITVNYKFFVYNKNKGLYSTFPGVDGKVRKFSKHIKESGLVKMISTADLKTRGLLVDDEVTFGVAAYVIQSEVLSLDDKPASPIKQWTIDLSKESSPIIPKKFSVGDRRWTVEFYPKGNSITDMKHVAFYLILADADDIPSKRPVYAKFKLRIVNQKSGKDLEKEAEKWFSKTHKRFRFPQFTEQTTLFTSNFIKDNKVKLEAEILVVSKVKVS